MQRILLMVLRNILFVPYGWIRLNWVAARRDKYTEDGRFAVLRMICRRAIKGGNIVLESSGAENLPAEDGFILYPNHQGMFDVLAILHACPRNFGAVAKKEIKDIPFLKQVFKIIGAYNIDREDLRQSMEVILNVTKDVKGGKNFLIFAEGTRSKMGNKLLEFKGGSFKAATKAKAPIVPVALLDSYKAFDTGSISKIKVQVHFLKPMYYEEYKDMKTVEIAAEVKRRIEEAIAEKENS